MAAMNFNLTSSHLIFLIPILLFSPRHVKPNNGSDEHECDELPVSHVDAGHLQADLPQRHRAVDHKKLRNQFSRSRWQDDGDVVVDDDDDVYDVDNDVYNDVVDNNDDNEDKKDDDGDGLNQEN